MHWIHLEGDYFDIGYQLGWWWGQKFKRLQQTQYGQAFLQSHDKPYSYYLNRGWDDTLYPLFENTVKYFPEVMGEISGISQGATDAGFPATIPAIFALTIEEQDIQRHHCSAVVVKQQDGFVLGHNEENDQRYPLCYAKVSLSVGTKKRSFASVSYPFELLASSAGMTNTFAFQNNSIGHANYEKQLSETWKNRLPKVVILRKLLELTSIKEIKQLYASHHLALPFHQYICFADKSYSFEVRPLLNPYALPRNQICINEIKQLSHIHTNHFTRACQVDMDWAWNDRADLLDTQARRLHLRQLFMQTQIHSDKNVRQALQSLARMDAYRDYTSATLLFKIQLNRNSCHAISYFNDRIEHIDRISITKS